jgi:hypothetical protein
MPLIWLALFVTVVAFAVVGTAALDGFGAARLVVIDLDRLDPSPFHGHHGSQPIN